MKKKHLIVLIFLLFFNINIASAEQIFYFRRDEFVTSNEGTDDYKYEVEFWGDFITMICMNDIASCMAVCPGSPSFGEDEAELTSNNNENCKPWNTVTSFKVGDGSYHDTKTYIMESVCEGVEDCGKHFYENYCKSNPGTNDFCSKLHDEIETGNSGEVNEGKDGSTYVTCDYRFQNYYDFYHKKKLLFGIIKLDTGVTIDMSEVVYKIDISPEKGTDYFFIGGMNRINNPGMGSDTLAFHTDDSGRYYLTLSDFYHKVYFNGKEKSYEQFKKEYIESYNNNNKCPELYYGKTNYSDENSAEIWYTEFDPDVFTTDERYADIIVENIHGGSGINGDDYEAEYVFPEVDNGNILTLENCAALFSDSPRLLTMITTIVNIIKIGIPILLVGLGTLDFSKAIFEGSEDNMKKAQGKFIKRVIIGVCIFLIPTVLKLILGIANSVWGNISADFCGIL